MIKRTWEGSLRFLCSKAMPDVFELRSDGLPNIGMAPEHFDDVYNGSGLVPDLIAEQQLRSVPPNLIRPLLGFVPRAVRSALLFPFFDLADKELGLVDFVRMKVFPPSCDSEGRTVKYLQRRDTGSRLYVVKRVADAVRETTQPLFLIEGEKKAMAAAQHGYAAVGFSGVENWHSKGSRQLLPDFDAIPLAGRVVNLVPDGDVQSNENVARGVEHFAEGLDRRGARVRVVLLPQELAA